MPFIRVEQVERDEAVPAPPVADGVLEDLRTNRRGVTQPERTTGGVDREWVGHPLRVPTPMKVPDATEALAVRRLGQVMLLLGPGEIREEHTSPWYVDRFVAIALRPSFGVDGLRDHWASSSSGMAARFFFETSFAGSMGMSASRSFR